MSKLSKIIYFVISVLFFTSFDLYFSELIIDNLRLDFVPNPVFSLTFVKNTGAAFSILEDYKFFLITFSIIAILIIVTYAAKHVEKFSTISGFWAAMLVAGIGCNLYERITFGYVRDFFQLNFIDFPVFNISDIFINIGVLAIIVIIIKNKYLKNNDNN